jgi:hypothetical protein
MASSSKQTFSTELLELARLAGQDRPFIKEQLARLNAAAEAPGPSGALRRAVHAGRRDLWQLARDTSMTMETIDDFLQGGDLSVSDFIKLAQACGLSVTLSAVS